MGIRRAVAALVAVPALMLGAAAPGAVADEGDAPTWGTSVAGGTYQQGDPVTAGVSATEGGTATDVTAALERTADGTTWRLLDHWTVHLDPGQSAGHSFALPDQVVGHYAMRLRVAYGDGVVLDGPVDAAHVTVFAYDIALHGSTTGGSTADTSIPRAARAITLDKTHRPRTARLGRSVLLSGTLSAGGVPLAGQQVLMQVAAKAAKHGGWATVPGSVARTDGAGRFTLAVPTYYDGHHTYRVEAPQVVGHWVAAGMVTGWAEAASGTGRVRVPRGHRTAGTTRDFSYLYGSRRAGPAVRWNGCVPIGYQISRAHAPAGAARLVARALAKVTAATGLRFAYAGRTRYRPYRPQGADNVRPSGITIAWASPGRVPTLAGDVLGYGTGTHAVQGRWTAGAVVLDDTFGFERGFRTTGHRAAVGAVLLHELGHVIGLGHVRARSQVMYPLLGHPAPGGYQAGDLAGLHTLGLEAGCL
jgi:hypothetical protein